MLKQVNSNFTYTLTPVEESDNSKIVIQKVTAYNPVYFLFLSLYFPTNVLLLLIASELLLNHHLPKVLSLIDFEFSPKKYLKKLK